MLSSVPPLLRRKILHTRRDDAISNFKDAFDKEPVKDPTRETKTDVELAEMVVAVMNESEWGWDYVVYDSETKRIVYSERNADLVFATKEQFETREDAETWLRSIIGHVADERYLFDYIIPF